MINPFPFPLQPQTDLSLPSTFKASIVANAIELCSELKCASVRILMAQNEHKHIHIHTHISTHTLCYVALGMS